MAYTKTNWVDDQTPVNAKNLNNIEEGVLTLDQELIAIKGDIAGKAEEVHTHEALENAIAGKAEEGHTHDDLQQAINGKAESNHSHTDLQEAIDGKAEADHQHADLETRVEALESAGPGEGVDLTAILDRIAELEAKVAILEESVVVNGEGHVHADLNTRIAAVETGKSEVGHTHTASEIITG